MTENIKATVRDHYAEAARKAAQGDAACCCSDTKGGEPVSLSLYSESEVEHLPEKARLASLGCGNPTALADLEEGEVVLDLGSGGGIDVLLSAQRVGPTGKAYGLDMTDEMLDLARENQRRAGVENVEFLKGEMEDIPLPDASVDVIISNCVINLSADKGRVIEEAFRVLRPGGRFAVSDVVALGELPPEVRHNAALWSSCLGGALEEGDYRTKLAAAGFEDVALEPTRNFEIPGIAPFMSAFVRARKPA